MRSPSLYTTAPGLADDRAPAPAPAPAPLFTRLRGELCPSPVEWELLWWLCVSPASPAALGSDTGLLPSCRCPPFVSSMSSDTSSVNTASASLSDAMTDWEVVVCNLLSATAGCFRAALLSLLLFDDTRLGTAGGTGEPGTAFGNAAVALAAGALLVHPIGTKGRRRR